jgi:hypothetical protein
MAKHNQPAPLIAVGGAVLPGAGWAYVTVCNSADSKPSWKCNFCNKITCGNNHTRVFLFLFIFLSYIYIMLNDFADLGASYLAGRLKMKCGMTLDSGILSKLVLRSFGLRAGTTFF